MILYPKIKTRAHLTILKSYRTLVDNMLKTVKILVKNTKGFEDCGTKWQHWKIPLKPGGVHTMVQSISSTD